MNTEALTLRANRIAKLKSLKTIELSQLRQQLGGIRQQQLLLEKRYLDKKARLSHSLGMMTQQTGSPGIHCEQIQIAWQFVESLRNDITRLRSDKDKLASEEDELQRQITLMSNQIERFTEANDQLSNEIMLVLQHQESIAIEDLISGRWKGNDR